MADRAEPGTVIAGRYELVRLLGEGGMGAVYQARQLSMERMVALKLIHAHIASRPEVAARFHREMQACSRIEHPSTIQVFDYGEAEGGRLFLAMEYLEGRSLAAILKADGPLPPERALHVARQIARALGAAHHEGIAHRDLKPDNVMLLDRYGERDVVKVLDFGIARFFDGDAGGQMTQEGALLGTPAYMSPEQALGRAVDHRTDLYSLGVMLYELTVGRLPFQADSLAGYLVAHASEAPPLPSLLAPGRVPAPLEALILRLLAKAPDERPASAEALLAELDACGARSTPVGNAAVETASRTAVAEAVAPPAPPRGQARWFVAAAAIALGGVAAAALVYTRAAPAADRTRLDALLGGEGDPLPPSPCRTRDAALVDRLTRAASALRGGVIGAPRAQDREALAQLAAADGGAAAERRALLARARLIVEPNADGALADAQAALALCPGYALAHNLAGNAQSRAGRFDDAATEYRAALAAEPGYVDPRVNLGVLALQRGDHAGAAAILDEALQRSPTNARAHAARASARIPLKRFDEAAQDLEQALAQDPEDADVWVLLGQLRSHLGKREAARDAFCRAAKLGHPVAKRECPSP